MSSRVGTIYLSYSGGSALKSRLKSRLPCLACLCVPLCLQTYAAVVPQFRPRPSPSESFPLHCLLVVLPFDAVVTRRRFPRRTENCTFNSQSMSGYHCLVVAVFTLLNYILVLNIFLADALHIQVLYPTTTQSNFYASTHFGYVL